MYLVGLTGGIGSGKSTVARLLAERGAEVIDADRLAREVVEPGTGGFRAVVSRFGDEVIGADGTLDRARLAELVFSDETARRDLEGIVHPLVAERVTARLSDLAPTDRVVVLDVPLLVESETLRGYQAVVVVTAPETTRVERVVRERGMAPEDVRARARSQASDDQRAQIADHVIDNSGDLDELARQVDEVWRTLRSAAREEER